jgi:putative CRISPR-associated protein (TIGR02619 family)
MNTPSRTIVCTVGTSIANGCKSIQSYYQRTSAWGEDVSDLKNEIQSRLDALLASNDMRLRACAEIHSLHHLGCVPSDEVILFTSDTAEGKACGETLCSAIRQLFGVKDIRLAKVSDLQARDGERLKRRGIPNLINLMTPILQDPQRRYSGGVILNPTGGFKGVVPFMTVLGMLYGAKVVYMFEFSNQLVTLPPLPVTLDPEIFERARPALEWAKEQAVFAPSTFFGFISGFDPDEEPLFTGFLEIESSSEATLSPLAMVLLDEETNCASHVMISRTVKSFIEDMGPDERARMESLAWRLASPLSRRNMRKVFYGTDLEVFGRSRFAARFAGFTENAVFHLCLAQWVTSHDDYEKEFASKNRRDFDSIDEFTRMDRPKEERLPADVSQTTETWLELRKQRDDLQQRCARLESELQIQRKEQFRNTNWNGC